MENKVGDNVPADAKLKALLQKLEEVVAELRKFGVTLDTSHGLHRPRLGFEPHAERVEQLSVKYGVQLPAYPLDGMRNDLRLSRAMQPFVDAYNGGLQISSDTASQAGHEF